EPAEPAPGLVYDVLDDRPLRVMDLVFIGFYAIGVVLSVVCGVLFMIRPPKDMGGYFGPLVRLGVLLAWSLASAMYLHMAIGFVRDQARCKAWRRSGEYGVAEGAVSELKTRTIGAAGFSATRVSLKVGGELINVDVGTNRGGFQLATTRGTAAPPFL